MYDVDLIVVFDDGYSCDVSKLTEFLVHEHGSYNLKPVIKKV